MNSMGIYMSPVKPLLFGAQVLTSVSKTLFDIFNDMPQRHRRLTTKQGSISAEFKSVNHAPWNEVDKLIVTITGIGSYEIKAVGSSSRPHPSGDTVTVSISSSLIKIPGDGKGLKPLREFLPEFMKQHGNGQQAVIA